MKFLVIKSGERSGEKYELSGHLVLGRARDCDVRLETPGASRKHALVMLRADGAAILRDLGSRNGTTIDGEPVQYRILAPGTRFSVGEVEVEFTITEDDPDGHEQKPGTLGTPGERTTQDQGHQDGSWKELLQLARELRRKRPDSE